jgi:phage terminase large subunit
LKLLRPTIRKEGSEIWFTWNPENDSDPVDVLLRSEIKPKNAIVKKVNYKDNPWFPDVLEDERQFDRQHDPDGYGHTWDGDYVTASKARVFKNWIVEEFEAPADSMFRFGADWGFSVDPTTLVRCYMVGRKIYIDYEAYQVGCEIKDTPDLFMTVPESEMWPIVADSARPETISHIRKHGFPKIMKAIKGPKSLEEGVAFVKTYQLIIHPRCEHVIDELTHYKYKLDPATEKPTSILEDKHNHVIDALRYAVENVRRAVKANKTIDHKPIPRVNKW